MKRTKLFVKPVILFLMTLSMLSFSKVSSASTSRAAGKAVYKAIDGFFDGSLSKKTAEIAAGVAGNQLLGSVTDWVSNHLGATTVLVIGVIIGGCAVGFLRDMFDF